MAILDRFRAAVARPSPNGETVNVGDGYRFVASPAQLQLRTEDLLVTRYGDWMQSDPRRYLAVIMLCIMLFTLLQEAMPWESLLFAGSRVDEHDTPDGVVTYTAVKRPVVAKICHVFVQVWLGFTLLHFPNKDLFMRQLKTFDTCMIVWPTLVLFAMWIVIEESKHPSTIDERIYYVFSQISKIPSLLVLACMDSVRMSRWLKVTTLLLVALICAHEYFSVVIGTHQLPAMEACAYRLPCATAISLYKSGLSTVGVFLCKAAKCYWEKHAFAVVRPRYVVAEDNVSWHIMGSQSSSRSDVGPPPTDPQCSGIDSSAVAAVSKSSLDETVGKRIPILTGITSAATAATLAALASSPVGDQAQLQLGREAGLREFVESVVTSVQATVEADLFALSGGPEASYKDWDLASVIGISATAAAEGARLYRDSLKPHQDQAEPHGIVIDRPADGDSAELKKPGLNFAKADAMGRGVSEPPGLLAELEVSMRATRAAEVHETEGTLQALVDATTALAKAKAENDTLHEELAASNASKDLIQKQLSDTIEERDLMVHQMWLSYFPSSPSVQAAHAGSHGLDVRANSSGSPNWSKREPRAEQDLEYCGPACA